MPDNEYILNAFQIVVDLARQNMADDDELPDEFERQLEAIFIVENIGASYKEADKPTMSIEDALEKWDKPTMSIEDALEKWSVHDPAMWENEVGPKGWWAVSNDDGIVAYFPTEVDALRHRLQMINRDLNP